MPPAHHPSVSIVAVAARTPVGLTAPASAAAVRAGISRVGAHPFMLDGRGEPLRMAVDMQLDPKLLGGRRLAALARSALAELEDQLGANLLRAAEIFMSLPEGRPGFSEQDANDVVDAVKQNQGFRPAAVTLAGRGHAGALRATSAAVDRLRQGRDLCVVVGADSYADADTIDWLDKNRQLAGEDVRSGFIPGEAAGAIVVTTGTARRSLRLASLAEVRGVGTALESRLIKSKADVVGEGLYTAIAAATRELTLPDEAIDDVYSDINGERYRTDEWGFAVLRLGRAIRQSGYHAPSTSWGDVGAASGTLGCVLAARSWSRGYAAGRSALVWGSSEGGLRGAIALQVPRN
jgi:3-oxoacyl-[acyl-carrier-protein] synthase-1